MPPNPTAPVTNAIHSGTLRSVASSVRTERPAPPAPAGTSRQSPSSVAAPRAPMSTYDTRHPNVCPTQVDSGTPTTFAIVRPVIIVATARPRCAGPATAAPTAAPTPKNAPCGSPARNRPSTSQPTSGAAADSTLATV